jgi:hypothetical protein
MENQDVIIYLNTPLAQPQPKSLEENTYQIKGKVVQYDASGITLLLKALGNDRGWSKSLSDIKKIFFPMHKIDYVVLE